MTAPLPDDLEEYVKAKAQSGEYLIAAQVVVDALYLLQNRDTLRQIKLERLRKEISIGIEAAESGELAPLDAEKIIAVVRKRLKGTNND
jgi:antitoxin ParD1/3/4